MNLIDSNNIVTLALCHEDNLFIAVIEIWFV